MKDTERRKAAKEFAEFWKDKGYEKGESQPFWLSLLRDVLGVPHPEQIISFEEQVKLDHTSFIDGYIASTHVLIEQKSIDKDLRKPIKQSDGTLQTPFQQAKRYAAELPVSLHPKYIIACNFKEFLIYDMEKPTGEPESILLCELEKEYYRLQFIVEEKSELLRREEQISFKAGDIVRKLYDALLKQYINPDETSLRSLNMLCVRLVFCLYAEDAGVFDQHQQFYNYLKKVAQNDISDVREALIKLFEVLNTHPDYRDKYLKDELKAFPYVNGGLFADTDIEIPHFTQEIIDVLLHDASENFDWSKISPTIFGALFESTLNPETRRSGGMHYTSVENIHKVIDPLFLDELRKELDEIKEIKLAKTRENKINAFREKLGSLTFFDPACGSGNFLTETYLSLRRLENEAIDVVLQGQMVFDTEGIIKVSIGQFYGIEINDFAVSVAKTALWIAESQMMKETEMIAHTNLDFLPLKSYSNIVEGNALRIDWETVVPKEKLNYIMGNPPFVGGMMMTKNQKDEIIDVVGNIKGVGEMDYVSAWYYKTAHYIQDTNILATFVSTNSICQGQQAVTMWKPLFALGVHIDFAHRTFRWDNRVLDEQGKKKKTDEKMAAVHCVIVGFSVAPNNKKKMIFSNERPQMAKNINPYLVDADNVFVESTSKPLCDAPSMYFGSMPRDGGGFVLSDAEKNELIKKEPLAKSWIRLYLGADEFINNKTRWVLWLVNANPHEIKKCSTVVERINRVKSFREASKASSTRKFAETPTLFCQIAQPDTDYIIVPRVSSENRKYVPIGFMNKETIASDAVQIIPDATLYHFGVLTSNVHMAWMRAVCGRLKSDYRYSKDIVYNNFPWCNPTPEQKAKIESTAQAILDARALYPDSSLADLYDELTMPPELRKAHQANDRAVMQAYGFDVKTMTESTCVAELMKMYQKLVGGK